jgi:hypothetical protein
MTTFKCHNADVLGAFSLAAKGMSTWLATADATPDLGKSTHRAFPSDGIIRLYTLAQCRSGEARADLMAARAGR